MINFKVSRDEQKLIWRIIERANKLAGKFGDDSFDNTMSMMDITACHANGCPLKLPELLEASDEDFSHDIFGIRRHINRETGELEDCFLPRFAA